MSKTIGFNIVSTIIICLILLGCVSQSDAQTVKSPMPEIKHVVMIGADGFGSHYVNWDDLPTLKMMKENGAWTLRMRSVLPSSSAINWASILMGAPSEIHGYRTWGSKEPDIPPLKLTDKGRFPCIFSVIRDQIPDAVTTIVYSWDGIGYLYEKEDVTEHIRAERDETAVGKVPNPSVLKIAEKQLAKKPTLSFIYFSDPDVTGHNFSWGSPEYQAKMTDIDEYVGKILKMIEANGMTDDTIVVFISDHGGSEKRHGDELLSHMEVPWILYGPGVKTGEITDSVVVYDNAATIAWILGLKQPQVWRGLPITSAFDSGDN